MYRTEINNDDPEPRPPAAPRIGLRERESDGGLVVGRGDPGLEAAKLAKHYEATSAEYGEMAAHYERQAPVAKTLKQRYADMARAALELARAHGVAA